VRPATKRGSRIEDLRSRRLAGMAGHNFCMRARGCDRLRPFWDRRPRLVKTQTFRPGVAVPEVSQVEADPFGPSAAS